MEDLQSIITEIYKDLQLTNRNIKTLVFALFYEMDSIYSYCTHGDSINRSHVNVGNGLRFYTVNLLGPTNGPSIAMEKEFHFFKKTACKLR